MLNLLPAFNPSGGRGDGGDGAQPRSTKALHSQRGGAASVSQKEWDPSASVAHNGIMPPYLDLQATARGKRDSSSDAPSKQLQKVDLAQEKQMMLPPNERYLPPASRYTSKDPSPLSRAARGAADDAAIIMPVDLQAQAKEATSIRRPPSPSSSGNLCLAVRTTNMTDEPLSVFVQKLSSTMNVTMVDPGRCATNVLRGTSGGSASDKAKETMHCVVVRTAEALVQLTTWQELVVVQFECRPLGLELEMRNDKIFCARVLQDSQAWGHEETLMGAEIIAIDDQRIATLEDFQFIVTALRMQGVGPRVQFVCTTAHARGEAANGSASRGVRHPQTGPHDATPGSSSSRSTRVIDADGDGMVASMRVTRQDGNSDGNTSAPLSWAYATSFGAQEVLEEEVVDDDAELELGPRHLVLAPPNASTKVSRPR